MTSDDWWVPDLSNRRGPRYKAITDALAEDVAARRLAPGTRLPPHRTLADLLGLTLGTVTRAYAEARQRGLIAGEVGRGTYVSPRAVQDSGFQVNAQAETEPIDLKLNQPAIDPGSRVLNETLKELSGRHNLNALLDYQPAPGKEHHRRAGAKWVARAGVYATPDQVVICNGAQQALMAALAALTRPGDVVVTEALNYPGIRRLATLFHVRLRGLPIDREGMIPEAFAEACASEKVAAVICTPTIHNPTAATLPLERRKRLVEIAAAHEVPIIEDDMYGQLPENRPPPIYSLAERGCTYIGGTSKSLVPGLRVAYLVASGDMVHRLADVVHSTTWTTSSLAAEIATEWINGRVAEEFIRWHRKEIASRQKLARHYLSGAGEYDDVCSYHIWLPLAEPLRADEFVHQAQAEGVALAPGSVFAVEPAFVPQAVRVSLGGPRSLELLETGLARLAGILQSRPMFRHVVV